MEKAKQILASTSEKLLVPATLDAVSLLEWSRAGMSPMQVFQEPGAFSPVFSPPQQPSYSLHESY